MFKKIILIKRTFHFFNLLLIVLTLPNNIYSADGKITGRIIDKLSGEALPFANVILEGSNIGAAADEEGYYSILNIPEGIYTVKATYLGYDNSIVENQQVVKNKTIVLDFELSLQTIESETVVVTAQAKGQIEAINNQLNSNTIKNVVASDRIQEIPDVNAAESVGRLPGVSILREGGEGNKVAIRGLAPKYNAVSVEGVLMSSTSGDDRSVDLSMISSNSLDGIEVTKSLTPDMDANALGGTINFKLRTAEEGLRTDVSVQGGYNQLDESYDLYKISGNISNRFLDNKFGVFLGFNIEQNNTSNDILTANYGVTYGEDIDKYPLIANSLVLTDRKELRKRQSLSLILDYKLPFGVLRFNNFGSLLDKIYSSRSISYNAEVRETNYNLSDVNSNELNHINNSLKGEFTFDNLYIESNLYHSVSNSELPNQRSYNFYQTGSINYLGERREVYDIQDYVTENYSNTIFHQIDNTFSDSREQDLGGKLDVKYKFSYENIMSGYLKSGFKYNYKERSYDKTTYILPIEFSRWSYLNEVLVNNMSELTETRNNILFMDQFLDNNYDDHNYLDGQFEFRPIPDLDMLNRAYNIIDNELDRTGTNWELNANSSAGSDHSGFEELIACYVMTELTFFDGKIMFLPGIRFEQVEHEYSAFRFQQQQVEDRITFPDTTLGNTNSDFFPMLHLRIKPADWFDIRMARTVTNTRPDYNDIIPVQVFSQTLETGYAGNPDLKPATAINYDIYTSFYSNFIGLFSIGGFYKEIDDMIWRSQFLILEDAEDFNLPSSYNNIGLKYDYVVNNQYKAYVSGFEIEWQTRFWYLPQPLNNIVLSVNYTKLKSSTKYPHSEVNVDYTTFPFVSTRVDTFSRGELVNQPSEIVNVSLGYDYKDFSFRIAYLYQDKILKERNADAYNRLNTYTKSYERFELQAKQKLPFYGLEAFLNVTNLTNTPDENYQYTERYDTDQEFYGILYNFGIRWRL